VVIGEACVEASERYLEEVVGGRMLKVAQGSSQLAEDMVTKLQDVTGYKNLLRGCLTGDI